LKCKIQIYLNIAKIIYVNCGCVHRFGEWWH